MSFSTGVAVQSGFGVESIVGTQATTIDHFLDAALNANMTLTQNWAQGDGLYAGGQVLRASKMVQTTREAKGTYPVNVVTRKMLPLFRQALGAPVSPTLISGTAYKTVMPLGSQDGMALTFQFGVPEANTGVVQPFTYVGCKVDSWDLSCAEGGLLLFTPQLDAKDELTLGTTPASNALAAASYTLPMEVFNHTQGSFKIGGTASTTTGVASIAGGVSVASLVKGFSLKATNNMAAGRYGAGSTKSEQKSKRTAAVLTLDTEFGTRAEFYDTYRAGSIVPVQITYTGSQIATTGSFNSIDVVLPACKIKVADPTINGDDMVTHAVELEVLRDDAGNTPIQVTITSADSAI